jgi:hypothetical protein
LTQKNQLSEHLLDEIAKCLGISKKDLFDKKSNHETSEILELQHLCLSLKTIPGRIAAIIAINQILKIDNLENEKNSPFN